MTDQQWEDFLQMLERVGKIFVEGDSVTLFVHGRYDAEYMDKLADVIGEIIRTHGHDVDPLTVIRNAVEWEGDLTWYRKAI